MGLIDKLLGHCKDKPKEQTTAAQSPKNEFEEDEKTIDGVVRQLKNDLYKAKPSQPSKPKSR